MNAHQNHQSFVSEYQESAQTVQRFRMYAFAFQAGIWAILFCLRNLHVQQTNLIAVILFGIFLLSRVRDFSLRRNLDARMSQITLEGLNLEQRNPRLGDFFQGVLDQFGMIRTLLLRAIFDFMALYFFTNAAYRLTLDYNLSLAMNMKTFYPALGIIGFFLSDLYYKPLKALVKAKQGAFSS